MCDLSWQHGAQLTNAQFQKLLRQGMFIAFDTDMVAADFTIDTVIVQVMHPQEVQDQFFLNCWCELDLHRSHPDGQARTCL